MSGSFALYLNFHGKFVMMHGIKSYVGGDFHSVWGIDRDKFGSVDLKAEVNKLGLVSWAKLWYKIPNTEIYKEVANDKETFEMLSITNSEIRNIEVFVEGSENFDGTYEIVTKEDGSGGNGTEGDGSGRIRTGGDCTIIEGSSDLEDYEPSDSEEDDISIADMDYISDEDNVESRKKVDSMNDLFDLIDNDDGFDDIDIGHEYESEYEGSEESLQSSDDELEEIDKRNQTKKIVYDPKCNHGNLQIVLGMHFENGLQCREALTNWAIENGRFIQFGCVTKTKLMAHCPPPCPWKVYGSVVKTDKTFIIKTVGDDHQCPRAINNKLISSKWIAKRYLNVFRVSYHLSAKDLRAHILERYKSEVLKDRLYKGRKLTQELVRGSLESHYASIRSYIAELRRVDPEGRYELLLGEDGVFKGFFMGLSALRKGFKASCRPLIGFDGCFLKTYLGGILLCATGKDGNEGMFPFAWAVVEIENERCWSWFLKCLFEDLQIEDGEGWTFISDQQKGLQNAIHNLAPHAEHRNCARHVCMNWKKRWEGSQGTTLNNMFWAAVKSTNEVDFKLAIQKMKREKVAAYEDFMARDVTKFCKAFISTIPCSDMIDNNISESFNSYILNARGKHVIHMLEEIRNRLMVRQVNKVESMRKVTDRICPAIRKLLEKWRINSLQCTAYPALGNKFEMQHEGDKFVVHVDQRSCSCRLWDLTGIPCMHSISAIQFMKLDPADFVHEYYTVERYLAGYQFGIEPIRGNKMWPEVDGLIVKPPRIRRMPGRPKKKRIRAPHEKIVGNKMSKHGVVITCSKCLRTGHNARGCKNEAVQKPVTEKRKRGRPAKKVGVTITEGGSNSAITSAPNGLMNSRFTSARERFQGTFTRTQDSQLESEERPTQESRN